MKKEDNQGKITLLNNFCMMWTSHTFLFKFPLLYTALEAFSRVLLSVASEFRKQQCSCRMYRSSGLFAVWTVWNCQFVDFEFTSLWSWIQTSLSDNRACSKTISCRTSEDKPTPTCNYCAMFGWKLWLMNIWGKYIILFGDQIGDQHSTPLTNKITMILKRASQLRDEVLFFLNTAAVTNLEIYEQM